MKTHQKNQGFTLVEIMIAVFVLAIGLLGMAGLQMASLKNNHSAYLRTQAVEYAYDIADRIRANSVGMLSGGGMIGGSYDNQTPTQNVTCIYRVPPLNPLLPAGIAPVATPSGCTPAQMAGNDLYELVNEGSGAELPGATSVVCVDSTPNDGIPAGVACDGLGNVFAIKVWWTDDRSGTPKLFVTTVGF